MAALPCGFTISSQSFESACFIQLKNRKATAHGCDCKDALIRVPAELVCPVTQPIAANQRLLHVSQVEESQPLIIASRENLKVIMRIASQGYDSSFVRTIRKCQHIWTSEIPAKQQAVIGTRNNKIPVMRDLHTPGFEIVLLSAGNSANLGTSFQMMQDPVLPNYNNAICLRTNENVLLRTSVHNLETVYR